MPSFIAGANNTGAFVAQIAQLNISSHMPLATFPIIFAVAGATSTRSAFSAKEICAASHSSGNLNKSAVTTFWPESV